MCRRSVTAGVSLDEYPRLAILCRLDVHRRFLHDAVGLTQCFVNIDSIVCSWSLLGRQRHHTASHLHRHVGWNREDGIHQEPSNAHSNGRHSLQMRQVPGRILYVPPPPADCAVASIKAASI